jgi:hypothetical protein
VVKSCLLSSNKVARSDLIGPNLLGHFLAMEGIVVASQALEAGSAVRPLTTF